MTTTAPKSPLAPKGLSGAPPALLLTIRFSAALPDLELDIPRPSATTVVSLKHLIRSRLDKAHARRRLRFIHGGKILPDTAVLSSVLRALPLPPPPPSLTSHASETGAGRRGGKDAEDGDGGNKGRSKSRSKGKPRPYLRHPHHPLCTPRTTDPPQPPGAVRAWD
ncbi:hypothetical protein NUW58_g9968 [Xylaria curta]|uniref:Uncharacterized protein n=1 Tax=Xylaria curta TaxID=42375 RepID=A0ACC1MR84_9PEZI|nr:hypothetical protein NUW58_g9968 [Xylaria curta]